MEPDFQSNTKSHFKKYWQVYLQWLFVGIYFVIPKEWRDDYFHALLWYFAYLIGSKNERDRLEYQSWKIHHAPVLPFKPKKGCLYYRLFMGTPKLFEWDGEKWVEQEDDPLYPLKAEVKK